MPKKKKVLIIIHLCLAFTFLSSLLLTPLLKKTFNQKAQEALIEEILKDEARFSSLSKETKEALFSSPSKASFSYPRALGHLLRHETSLFALMWLFFSILLSCFILFRIEGAEKALIILPALTLAFAIETFKAPPSSSCFPSEAYVLRTYVPETEGSFREKRRDLLKGWHRYLIHEWAHERPSEDETHFQEQLQEGLYAFNVHRVISGEEMHLGFKQSAPITLLFYLVWNTLFVWKINQWTFLKPKSPQRSSTPL